MNYSNISNCFRNVGKGCQTVPKCYKSECRQRFRYDTLLVFDPCDAKRAPMLELFKIPDGCECFVIVEEPDLVAGDPVPTVAVTKRTLPTSVTAAGRSGDFGPAVTPAASPLPPSTTTQSTTSASTVSSTEQSTTTEAEVISITSVTETAPTKQSLILAPRVIYFSIFGNRRA